MDYSTNWGEQCDAWKLNHLGPARKRCSNPVTHVLAEVTYLCTKHMNMVVDQIEDLIECQMKDQIANLESRLESCRLFHGPNGRSNMMRTPQAKAMLEEIAASAPPEPAQYVYFIECEDYIRIGMSRDPEKRLKALQVSGNGTYAPKLIDLTTAAIVATEPGGVEREGELHRQFNSSRYVGRWFTKTPELTAYIDALTARELLAR